MRLAAATFLVLLGAADCGLRHRFGRGDGRQRGAAPQTATPPPPRGARLLLAVAADAFQCRECPADTYCYDDALARCPEHAVAQNGSATADACRCKPGFAQNASWAAGGACLPCPAGFYCAGGFSLLACPEGSRSAPGSSARASCVCGAGFAGADAGALALGELCAACAPGAHKPESGGGACAPCAAGTYAPASGAAECAACPANTVSGAGAAGVAACVAAPGAFGAAGGAASLCPPGFFADRANSSACEPCPSYTFLPASGATSVQACLACPDGAAVYASLADPVAPNGVGVRLADCVCAPGRERSESGCTLCAAGAHKEGAGDGACAPCPADTWGGASGVNCLPCPANSGSGAGAESSRNCSCDAGYAALALGEPACPSCADFSCGACGPGTFKAEAGSGGCRGCAAGHFQPGSAQSACLECGEDSFVPAPSALFGAGACGCRSGFAREAWRAEGGVLRLAPNADGDGDGDADCGACPPGYFRNASAASEACEACPPGAATAGAASASAEDCAPCEEGAYSALAAEGIFCRACMPHANTSRGALALAGALARTLAACECDAGYFRATSPGAAATLAAIGAGFSGYALEALEGNVTCEACAGGKFKAAPGNEACTPCPAGTGGGEPAARGADACAPCRAGTHSRLLAGAQGPVFGCVACPAHSASAAGSTAPENCTCDSGFAFAGTGEACEPCAAGWFRAAGPGTQPCARCARGSYALGAASACGACPPNTTTAEEGAPSASACVCERGFAGPACALCAPGRFSTSLGASACEDCGEGMFQSRAAAPGERACAPCPPNSSAAGGALGAEACVAQGGFVRVAGLGALVALEVLWPHAAAGLAQAGFARALGAAGASGCACPARGRVTRVVASARRRSRRLLSEGAVVGVEIDVPDLGAGAQLVAALSVESINAALAGEGVPPISHIVSGPTLLATEPSFGQCPADSYCPAQDLVLACPPNSSSPAGSAAAAECACVPGFYAGPANASACALCPVDSFCPGGALASACAANSSTGGRVGAAARAACGCDAGTFREPAPGAPDGYACVVCPADSFCAGELRVECPPASSAPRGARSADDCQCHAGTLRTALPNGTAFECALCPPTMVCHAGGAVEFCAANASNVNFACRCAPGARCLAPDASGGFGPSCDSRSRCAPCARAHFCDGVASQACAPGEDAPEASASAASCRCVPGFYRSNAAGAPCAPCEVGFACPGGVADRLHAGATWLAQQLHASEGRAAVALFDAHLTTPGPLTVDVSRAVCEEGFFRTARWDACKLCPQNFWCPPEREESLLPNVVACLENEVTPAPGASAASECYCAAGFKTAPQDAVTRCMACAAGERCQAGEVVEAQCHAMKRVPNADHSKCVCDIGHGEYQLACAPCPPGSSKPLTGDAPCAFCGADEYVLDAAGPCLACPAHASSRPGSSECTCAAPFVSAPPGPAGAAPFCELCADDHFWASRDAAPSRALPLGAGAPPGLCLRCPAASSSNASAAMPLGIPACRCAAGHAATPEVPRNLSLVGENITTLHHLLACPVCETGRFEDAGVCRRCAENATSAPGQSGAAACVCDVAAPAHHCRTQRVEGSCHGTCADTPAACGGCAPGLSKPRFSSPGNAERCAPCAVGFFQPAPGAPACEACPAHETTVLAGRAAQSDCRCVAGHARAPGSGVCAACAPGHHKPAIGDEPCAVCGAGRFQPAPNATACGSCAAATASLAALARALAAEGGSGSHALEANSTHGETSASVLECVCAAGHEPRADAGGGNGSDAALRCARCAQGSFKPGPGLDACFYCGRGDIPGIGGNGLNLYGNASASVDDFEHCARCPANSGQDAETVGPAAPMDGPDKCRCFPGFERRSALGCSICRALMMQPQYSDADCGPCPAGHYFVARQYPCVLCDLLDEESHARHQGLVANSGNLSLAWGVGEQDCVCRLGYERLADSATCTRCGAGSFRADPLARLCGPCAADTYQPQPAATGCLACPAHATTLNATGAPSLQRCVCDAGRENLVGGACALCAAGKYRAARGAHEAASACERCPADSYCPEGSAEPRACAPREVAAPGAASASDCQCSAGRGRAGAGEPCADCAPGLFSPGATNAACEPCPAHKNTSGAGASALAACACEPGHGVDAGAAAAAACAPCGDGFFARGGLNVPCVHCGFGAVSAPPSGAAGPEACLCDAAQGLGAR